MVHGSRSIKSNKTKEMEFTLIPIERKTTGLKKMIEVVTEKCMDKIEKISDGENRTLSDSEIIQIVDSEFMKYLDERHVLAVNVEYLKKLHKDIIDVYHKHYRLSNKSRIPPSI